MLRNILIALSLLLVSTLSYATGPNAAITVYNMVTMPVHKDGLANPYIEVTAYQGSKVCKSGYLKPYSAATPDKASMTIYFGANRYCSKQAITKLHYKVYDALYTPWFESSTLSGDITIPSTLTIGHVLAVSITDQIAPGKVPAADGSTKGVITTQVTSPMLLQ